MRNIHKHYKVGPDQKRIERNIPHGIAITSGTATMTGEEWMKNFARIIADPARMGGVPCVRGIRISVATVLRLLAGGLTEAEILTEYPDLQKKDIASACSLQPPQQWNANCCSYNQLEIPDRQCIVPSLAVLLQEQEHSAVHVRTYGMHAAKDEEILARALIDNCVVVSADSDFGTLLATQEAAMRHPSSCFGK